MIAGNPARVICSLEDYQKKREKAQLEEASELVREYYAVYNRIPPQEELAEFFWIFEKRTTKLQNRSFIRKMNCVNNYKKSMETFLQSEPLFDGYNSFIEYALKN